MLRFLFDRMIARLEKRWDYDANYVRMLNRNSPVTALKFLIATGMANRRDAPAAALTAAGVTGTLAEDCGPCTQLGVDMALAGGVPASTVSAILAGDEDAMGEEAALGYRFAKAVLSHDAAADGLREEIIGRWGEKGLVALALQLTAARMYPTLKYGLGFGRACTRVTVAGAAAKPARPMSLAA